MAEIITTEKAASLIKDNVSIGTAGFVLTGAPEEIFIQIEQRFIDTGHPKGISLMWASGIGDGKDVRGINHLCHEGLLKKVIGGHYGLIPKIQPLINENKLVAYNFPQGVLSQMFREMSAKKPGVLTHVGLNTFADPDYEGGKINTITKDDIVQKVKIDNDDYLFYKSQKIDVAVLRGTEADERGNIGFSKEALTLESLAVAMAAKNNGGIVIVQVERIVKNGTLNPKNVKIPGILVDYVAVVKDIKNHMQTAGTQFSENLISNAPVIKTQDVELPLNIRKIIARRAALELTKEHRILNFGIGMPEFVADIIKEEGIDYRFTSTVEPGLIGGNPLGGLNFGSAITPEAIIDECYQFDFYDGGGIDVTFLGVAQCDKEANINVSKFGPKIAGCGGFIDISQNAKEVVFCGSFTSSGLDVKIENGKLNIIKEGKINKFINKVEQITFNGKYEATKNKKVVLVTERAVFKLTKKGFILAETAPGIDLEKHVLPYIDFNLTVSDDLKVMDEKIFQKSLMGLKKCF